MFNLCIGMHRIVCVARLIYNKERVCHAQCVCHKRFFDVEKRNMFANAFGQQSIWFNCNVRKQTSQQQYCTIISFVKSIPCFFFVQFFNILLIVCVFLYAVITINFHQFCCLFVFVYSTLFLSCFNSCCSMFISNFCCMYIT